jgi:hypothetical protein
VVASKGRSELACEVRHDIADEAVVVGRDKIDQATDPI